MTERYNQIHGGKDIKEKTVDETRLNALGKTKGYILKVQEDGSVIYVPLMTHDPDLRLFIFES
jgi:hypothetical protein